MTNSGQVWVVLFYSLSISEFADCAFDVQLYEYKQSDSLTKCENGLIEGDRLVLYADISIDIFEIPGTIEMRARLTEFKHFVPFLSMPLTAAHGNPLFKDYSLFPVLINVTATTDLSQAMVRMHLLYGHSNISSNEIQLPIITSYKDCSKIELIDCPVVTEEDMIITCICRFSSNIYTVSRVKWLTFYDDIYFMNEAVITFTASRASKGYSCLANIVETAETISSTYKPVVIYKPQNLTCAKKLNDQDGINISCFTEKIFPQAKCLFVVIDKQGHRSYDGLLTYTHETRGDNPEYFASKCNLFLDDLHIPKGGTHNVTIIMFPKGNRTFNTYNFGVEKSILFFKIPYDTSINCSSTSEHELNVTCTVKNSFPEALCRFKISFHNIPYYEDNVLNTHSPSELKPMSVCSLFTPYIKLESGLYIVNVSLHPNVSEELFDYVSMISWSLNCLIETPRLRTENCTYNISEGQTVLCRCRGNVDVFIQETFQWYNNRRELLSDGPDLEITNVTGNQDEFMCRALDVKYRKLYSVTFKLTVCEYKLF